MPVPLFGGRRRLAPDRWTSGKPPAMPPVDSTLDDARGVAEVCRGVALERAESVCRAHKLNLEKAHEAFSDLRCSADLRLASFYLFILKLRLVSQTEFYLFTVQLRLKLKLSLA